MKLTPEQVKHIADLARLELSTTEQERYAEQLSSILEYVDQLRSVDTTGVEPTAQVTGLENVLREDVVDEVSSEVKQELIAAAPATEQNLIKAKSVF